MSTGLGALLGRLFRRTRRAPDPGSPDLRLVLALGNPGEPYARTRHNVAWWLVDHLQEAWEFGPFRKEGSVLLSGGQVGGRQVLLLKPLTYMNRSGQVLEPVLAAHGRSVKAASAGTGPPTRSSPEAGNPFDPRHHLLVVVDDATRGAGKIRFRGDGSPGGHNGLKSVEAALGSRDYPRLRLGVGAAPKGVSLADWVLSPMPPDDEAAVLEGFPTLVEGVERWMEEGIEAAMDHANR